MRFRVPRGSRSIDRLVYHANIDQHAHVTTSFVPGYRSLWPSCSRGPLHRRYSMCDLDCPRRSFELRRRMDSGVYIGSIGTEGFAGKILLRVKLIVDLSASRYE
jgi:hypothetical protein